MKIKQDNFIQAEQLNTTAILNILHSAYIKANEDEEGDIVIFTTGSKNVIYLEILKNTSLIHLSAFFEINKTASKEDLLNFINELNHKVIFSRFSIPTENLIAAEYFLSYEPTILPYNIINALRLFEDVTWSALRKYDNKNLIG